MANYARNTDIGKLVEPETVREVLEDIVGDSIKDLKAVADEQLEETKRLRRIGEIAIDEEVESGD